MTQKCDCRWMDNGFGRTVFRCPHHGGDKYTDNIQHYSYPTQTELGDDHEERIKTLESAVIQLQQEALAKRKETP